MMITEQLTAENFTNGCGGPSAIVLLISPQVFVVQSC